MDSLVAQRFNRIQPSRFDCRQDAANDTHEAEDRRRPEQRRQIDVEVNVSLAGVVFECAPQRQ